MVKRVQSNRTSDAIAELQNALDMKNAADKLVASKLARLATLLTPAESRGGKDKQGPVLVVNNPPPAREPISDNAA